jgi:hypothetical protein
MKDKEAFAQYLLSWGAEIQWPPNNYEILRYKLPDCGLVIIHTNARGQITMPTAAEEHYDAFKAGRPLKRQNRPGQKIRQSRVRKLLERDGPWCGVCNQKIEDETPTIEHYLSIGAGGSNDLANMCLAHGVCNQALGNLPVKQKIELIIRTRARLRALGRPPWEYVPPEELLYE